MPDLFLGVDAGGTSTRALLATADGDVIGTGRAEGANVWSSGTSVSGVIGQAIGDALRGSDPRLVAHGVIGVAGSLNEDDVAEDIVAAWRGLDLPGSPEVVPDVLVAYAAGTTAAHGAVLVAGTGSIAAAIGDGAVRRHVGGYGWMVGDEGSAVWLGLQGTRLALAALDGRSAPTMLSRAIPEALGVAGPDAGSTTQRIVRAAHGRPPAHLGRLAPVVLGAAANGDAVAGTLVDAAVAYLVDLVAAVIDDEERPVIVLTGSLLTRAPLIERPVRARLAARWPAARVTSAPSGEPGAAALAIGRTTGTPVAEATLARLRDGSRGRHEDGTVPSSISDAAAPPSGA